MVRKRPNAWHSLLSVGFAAAGVSKLLGVHPQRTLFASWGWSEDTMRTMGALELAGAVLITARSTRRLGGLLLSGSSAAVLIAEAKHEDDALLPPRAAMLLAAMTTLF